MRTCGLFAATALVGVALADVEIGGNYTFQRDAQVTMRLLIGGQLMSESSATVQMSGSARSIVTLSDMPSVPADLFTTQIVTGRVEAFEMAATDAPLSMMGITINLRNMRGHFGDCFGTPGTIDVFNNGPGGAFLDQFDGAIEIEGDLEMSGGVAPLAFATTVQLADGGPQAATILSEYDLSFQNNQLVQTIGIFDGGGVLAGGFVSDGVEVQLAFSIQTEIVGSSLVTPTQIQCCAESVSAGTFHDAGGIAEIPLGFGLSGPAVADFNGDGRDDIAISKVIDDRIDLLFSTGPGTFAPPLPINIDVGNLSAIDIDGDGDQDLVALNAAVPGITVLLNNGDGTFGAASNFPVANSPIAIDFGDLDVDGDLDAAVICDRLGAPNIFVLRNLGGGAFGAPEGLQSNNGPADVALGDIDGDADLDMVIPLGGADFVGFRRNDGTGTFTGIVGFNIAPSGGDRPVSIALFDFDNDSDLDVVVANENSDNITGIRNNNGLFTNGSIGTFPLAGADRPFVIVVGDFDGDDDRDVAVGYRGFDTPSGGVNTLLNDGAGVFINPVNHAMFATVVSDLDLADLDQDGDADLLATNDAFAFQPDHLTMLINGCAGIVAPPPCPGDVDGDGDIDLSDLSTLLANFGAASGQTRAQGDLDGDGDVDLSDLAQLLANFGGSCP
ncbi:MAG: FG-GAP repeat domain-containing protein [Phycisphaerae bacterium]